MVSSSARLLDDLIVLIALRIDDCSVSVEKRNNSILKR